MISSDLLEILVCPKCRGKLELSEDGLICRRCRLVYPVRDDIPIMLPEEAHPLENEGSPT